MFHCLERGVREIHSDGRIGHAEVQLGNSVVMFDLANRLRTHGWLVPAYALPPDREQMVVQRILVRHGVSRDLAGLLERLDPPANVAMDEEDTRPSERFRTLPSAVSRMPVSGTGATIEAEIR